MVSTRINRKLFWFKCITTKNCQTNLNIKESQNNKSKRIDFRFLYILYIYYSILWPNLCYKQQKQTRYHSATTSHKCFYPLCCDLYPASVLHKAPLYYLWANSLWLNFSIFPMEMHGLIACTRAVPEGVDKKKKRGKKWGRAESWQQRKVICGGVVTLGATH